MVKNMNTEATMEKVNEWMAENADHPLFSNVQGLIEDYERTNVANFLNAALALTKTVRQKIVLSPEEVIIRDALSEQLDAVFKALPNLSVPRKRNLESIQEAVSKAMKENKR